MDCSSNKATFFHKKGIADLHRKPTALKLALFFFYFFANTAVVRLHHSRGLTFAAKGWMRVRFLVLRNGA